MPSPGELDPAIYDRILGHARMGDDLFAGEQHYEALIAYNEALASLPHPKESWNASTWLLGSIGNAAFAGGYLETARDALQDAITHCPGGLGNPFLHLKLGQVRFELGETKLAVDELMRAYMAAGQDIFREADPKYLGLLRQHAVLPE